MPGIVYRALHKMTYDFSTLGNSQSVVYQAAKAIDVSAYREANLIVRVHSYNVSGSGTSITVNVYPEAPTDEDPATDFIGTSTVATTGTISQTNTFPLLNVQGVSTPFGGWLRIKLTGTQGATASTTFSVTISIDIVAKS